MTPGPLHDRPRGLLDVIRNGNLGALLLPLLLLAAGWGARARLSRKIVTFTWHGVELRHPAGWAMVERSDDPADGESVVLMDLLGPGRIKARVTLRIAPLPVPPPAAAPDGLPPEAGADAGQANGTNVGEARAAGAVEPGPTAAPQPDVAVAETLSNRLPLYYALGEQTMQIGTVTATRVDSAFAFTPRATFRPRGDIPVVLRAIDLVLLRGPDALSIQVAAPIEDFEAQRPTLEAILASVRIDPSAAPAPEPTPPPPMPRAAESPDAGSTEAGVASGDVEVAGQVLDAESGLPVPGAIVVFLAPGSSVDDVSDDNLTQIAYTTALADSSGHFATNRPLARPAHYGVMVVADGYRWIASDDGVSAESETPDHLDVGAVRIRRR